jgi:hypothetical protein
MSRLSFLIYLMTGIFFSYLTNYLVRL